jgi:lipoprotein signal peptidase
MSEMLYKPKTIGISAIIVSLIPTYWTFFFFITIPVMIVGLLFLFIKPATQLTYEIPATLLLIGSLLCLILTIISLMEMSQNI